jgi:hypothetical protein
MSKPRAILNAGKVVEITAVSLIVKAGGSAAGTIPGWRDYMDFCNMWGFDVDPTDESSARQRTTNLYTPDGERINPGRGERIIDASVDAPILGVEHALRSRFPVSIKAGDSRDITVDIPALRGWVESGAPLWTYCLNGESEAVYSREGVVPWATNLTMRRVDAAAVIRAQAKIADPWSIDGPTRFAKLRRMKVGKYEYTRFNINWNKVPSHLWMDSQYIPFNPSASLPAPWSGPTTG